MRLGSGEGSLNSEVGDLVSYATESRLQNAITAHAGAEMTCCGKDTVCSAPPFRSCRRVLPRARGIKP